MNRSKLFSLVLVALLFLSFATLSAAQSAPTAPDNARTAAQKAADYLRTAQHADGGFGPAVGGPSTLGQTTDAIFAFATNGNAPAGVKKGDGQSLTYYLLANIGTATGPASLCKSTLAAITSLPVGGDTYGGVNVRGKISDFYNNVSGRYGGTTLDQVYCMLASQNGLSQEAINALKSLQLSDGSFAFAGAGQPGEGDTNTTSLAIQTLRGATIEANDPSIQKAIAFLKTQQNADGGFPYQKPSEFGTDTDANSTAYVIQGLVAAGIDPATFKSDEGSDPLTALLGLQNPSGAFRFQGASGEDNVLATLQAVPALRYAPQPIAPVRSDAGQTYPTPNITSLPALPSATAAAPVVTATAVASGTANPSLPTTGHADYLWLTLIALAGFALAAGLSLRTRRA